MPEERASSEFTRLLDYLKASRGFDFGAYKVSSLMRRVQKRMRDVGVTRYGEYTDYLEVHPNEFEPLFDTILINVTGFFRDTPAWDFLGSTILPRIIEQRGSTRPLRIWSAGCASGEEPFSLAMTIAEVLGEDELRRAKIYATDADNNALAQARQGSFEARQVTTVPQPLLDKYFDRSGNRFIFRSDLRRCLVFGRHDLIQDAAISRLDLLLCRNTLMYFNAEVQEKILARFHFALAKNGYLFLGKAETLLTHGSNFRPVDLRHRIFMPAPTVGLRERLLAFTPPGSLSDPGGEVALHIRLREAAFDATPVAQVVIDRRGCLILANEKARRLFGLGNSDLGRVLQDFELSYRPVELRSHLETVYATRSPVVVKDVEWRGIGEPRLMEIHLHPLFDARREVLGVTVSFQDMTVVHQLRIDLERSNQELETAFEELQSANEELETTNEELQSTVEELETTNEELQSANEELETMNEELQSTNDELRVLNDQMQMRSDDLHQINLYFESILSNLRSAIVVLDRNLQVKVWSPKAEDLWGVRAAEVGALRFSDLDIGLPVDQLREPLRQCLAGTPSGRSIVLDGVNRRGKPMRCEVQCTPLKGPMGTEGAILLIREVSPAETESQRVESG